VSKHIVIIGGSCVDIFAVSAQPLVPYDSNPGTVNIGFGGVGRNIAENLARLGQAVTLIAAFGDDPFSNHMLAYTNVAGVDIDHTLIVPHMQSPYYISVNDPGGEMNVAVNDMRICEQLSPSFLRDKLPVLNQADAVVIDTNIPQATISWIVNNCRVPLFADGVSTKKVRKLLPSLSRLHGLKVNLLEAAALLETPMTADYPSLCKAADRLHEIGIPHVFITLGKTGAFMSCSGRQLLQNAYSVTTRNANGCGDAFSAAAFLGVLNGDAPENILRVALAAAAVTAQSAQAVSTDLTLSAILSLINEKRERS
jgi:pseudouridine kinase